MDSERSMTLKVLNFPFVPLRRLARGEGPEVAPLAGFGILLSGIQTVLS